MEQQFNDQDPFEDSPILEKPKVSFWRKLGGGSLTLSIIVHAIFLAIGVVWIVAVIPPPPEKEVDFMPSGGGGGGSPSSSTVNQQKQQANRVMNNAARVAAAGVTSDFTLPEPDLSSSMSEMGSLGAGALSGGLGGSGSGGGRGDGHGTGVGSGTGPGFGGGFGGGNGTINPFGVAGNSSTNALVGTFYDLKQTSNGRTTDYSPEQARDALNEFTNRGWRDQALRKYYQAKQKLYQTKIYMPQMAASAAPAAFNCEKEVQPSRWAVVYRGMVSPPESGTYRFVGAGDDILAVRFNGKNVFDYGWYSATTPVHLSGKVAALQGKQEDKELERTLRRDYPMDLPITMHQYSTTRNWNNGIGGLAVGPKFEAEAGKAYPIEILISELPGGLFGAALLIEKVGTEYQKTPEGSPILPLFRIDQNLPPPSKADNSPPFDPNSPPWKLIPGQGKLEI